MFKKIINYFDPKKAKVFYIIDGDTFMVATGFANTEKVKIRLARVNAPEIANAKYGKLENQKGSQEAKKYLTNRLLGKYITYTSDNQIDSYDRVVAWVFDENFVDICQELVFLGLATVFFENKNDQLQKDLLLLQEFAKSKKIGIWKN